MSLIERIVPGGVDRANERPGIQPGEPIQLKFSRQEDPSTEFGDVITSYPWRGEAPDQPGTYRLGQIANVRDRFADLTFSVEAGPNYAEDTAGSELAAGTEGTVTDPIADAASRATSGRTNDGQGLVDSSGGSISVAGLSGVALAALAAVAFVVLGGND